MAPVLQVAAAMEAGRKRKLAPSPPVSDSKPPSRPDTPANSGGDDTPTRPNMVDVMTISDPQKQFEAFMSSVGADHSKIYSIITTVTTKLCPSDISNKSCHIYLQT